ncbi:MAG: YqgE/AlgH family protein, partial [Acidimicrobiia bacterium]
MSTEGGARRLLVAAPTLLDPNFRRTVVFIVEHTRDGALGVVLNRPSRSEVAELFPSWAERAAHPGFVFVGGPVHTDDALVALGRVVAPGAPDAS